VTSYDVGTLDEFEQGIPRQLRVGDRVLVAVRVDETLYVLDDRCSHEEFSLSEGEVDVDTAEIECARHGAMFDPAGDTPRWALRSSQPRRAP
jgi:3-phenylpropionate/trans-cinnamate dioxygenase ferredoxin subunit